MQQAIDCDNIILGYLCAPPSNALISCMQIYSINSSVRNRALEGRIDGIQVKTPIYNEIDSRYIGHPGGVAW
jgi:hypothetical protein